MSVMRFKLHLEDPTDPAVATTTEVRILPADRMRAERHSTTELAPSQRGAASQKLFAETWLLLWLWCSATRQGVTTAPFQAFVGCLTDYTRLDADGAELADGETPEDEPVDPTQPVEVTG